VPAHTPSDRRLIGQQAAHTRWAHEPNRTAATAAGRAAFEARFELAVDPDGVLAPHERAKRAENARKAHFAAMARKSAASRRRKAAAS
jgi:hypothetical protein